jgi:hypothetical protein
MVIAIFEKIWILKIQKIYKMISSFMCLGLYPEGLHGYPMDLDVYRVDMLTSVADYAYRSTRRAGL